MVAIKWDIKRGADIYRSILDNRLKLWISTGKIKPGEVVVWKISFSGWRKPEELEELIPYFKRYEKIQLRKIERREQAIRTLPEKTQIKYILIIDDEKDLCELLTDTLTSQGYNVAYVSTNRDAIKSMKRSLPELIFLDLKLPDGDGMKLLSKIKKVSASIVVNIISAYGSEESREEAIRLGAHRFIDKPFNERDISRSIEDL